MTAPGIDPVNTSPPAKWISAPLIRGAPVRRSVAIVLCLCRSSTALTRAANSGASFSKSAQRAMPA